MPTFNFQRRYCGKVQAIICDWAGTVIDYGSRAPAGVFVAVYQNHGVAITMAEARGPMGMQKRDHIEAIANMPAVAERWRVANGADISAADIDRMYDEFLPLQLACLGDYAELIPGTLAMANACRDRGIKIGTSTGYSRILMNVVEAEAKHRGFVPDAIVTADDVPTGRPAPWMCFENARRLNIWPMAAVIKIDDTIPGIEAGLNAGMWTVGVAKSGNEMGLSEEEIEALAPADCERRLATAYDRLARCGSHYVIDSVGDLMPIIETIEARLERGETP